MSNNGPDLQFLEKVRQSLIALLDPNKHQYGIKNHNQTIPKLYSNTYYSNNDWDQDNLKSINNTLVRQPKKTIIQIKHHKSSKHTQPKQILSRSKVPNIRKFNSRNNIPHVLTNISGKTTHIPMPLNNHPPNIPATLATSGPVSHNTGMEDVPTYNQLYPDGYWVSDRFTCENAPGRNTTGNNNDYNNYCIFNNASDAEKQCNNDLQCIGYAHNPISGIYQLTHTSAIPNKTQNAAFYSKPLAERGITTANIPTKTTNPSTKVYNKLPNTDYPGMGDIITLNNVSQLTDCNIQCDKLTGCNGFVYNNANKSCNLKHLRFGNPIYSSTNDYYYSGKAPSTQAVATANLSI